MLSFLLLWGAAPPPADTVSSTFLPLSAITTELSEKYHISLVKPEKIPDGQVVLKVGKEKSPTYLMISRQQADWFQLLRKMLEDSDNLLKVSNIAHENILPIPTEYSIESILALLEWTSNSPSITDPGVFRLACFLDFKDQANLYQKNLKFIFQLDPIRENLKGVYDYIGFCLPYKEYKRYITEDNRYRYLFPEILLRTPKLNHPMEAYSAIRNTSQEQQAEFRQKYCIHLAKIGEDGVVPQDKLYVVLPHDKVSDPRVNQIFSANPDKIAVIDFGDQMQIPERLLTGIHLKNIIIDGPQITAIEGSFLSYSNLTVVDLSSLSNVTSIDYSFLFGCTGLTAVDLSSLRNLVEVGGRFLGDNTEARILVSDKRIKILIKDKNLEINDSRFVIASSSTNMPTPTASTSIRQFGIGYTPTPTASTSIRQFGIGLLNWIFGLFTLKH